LAGAKGGGGIGGDRAYRRLYPLMVGRGLLWFIQPAAMERDIEARETAEFYDRVYDNLTRPAHDGQSLGISPPAIEGDRTSAV
jgi:hypothetical protein